MKLLPPGYGKKGQCRCGHMRGRHYLDIETDKRWECRDCDCQEYHQNHFCVTKHAHDA